MRRYKVDASKKGYDFWSYSGYPSYDAKFSNVGGKPKI